MIGQDATATIEAAASLPLPKGDQDGWRPIDDAAKSGKPVAIRTIAGNVHAAFWNPAVPGAQRPEGRDWSIVAKNGSVEFLRPSTVKFWFPEA